MFQYLQTKLQFHLKLNTRYKVASHIIVCNISFGSEIKMEGISFFLQWKITAKIHSIRCLLCTFAVFNDGHGSWPIYCSHKTLLAKREQKALRLKIFDLFGHVILEHFHCIWLSKKYLHFSRQSCKHSV